MLRNRGNGTFENVSTLLGADFNRPIMGRGAAYLDFDGDGDLDVAAATLNGPAYLFRNDGTSNNWLQVRLAGSTSNRNGIGASVRVFSASGTQAQVVRSGSSYASQSDLALTFGLGRDAAVTSVEVTWPSGKIQKLGGIAAKRLVVIDEARGLQLNARPAARPSPAR
jgi:hypothetical protein